jgi:hypothetical protein
MTIDDALSSHGYRYDPSAEEFLDGERVIEWQEVIELVPGMTLDELASWQDAEHDRYRSRPFSNG